METLRLPNRLVGAVCPTSSGLLISITAVSQCGGKHARQLPCDPQVSEWVNIRHALVWPPASQVTTVCSPIHCPAHPNVTAQLDCLILCHSFVPPLKLPVPPSGRKAAHGVMPSYTLCTGASSTFASITRSKLFRYLCKKKTKTIS